VAEGYGFKNVFTPLDIKAWNPQIWPFYDLTPEERASAKPADFSQTPISAIYVFHDPRNWALDIQIMTDVLLGRGTVLPSPASSPPVRLVFCNPDLLWRAEFPRPRYGQGAFREAFQAVFKAAAGKEHPYVQYGKPSKETYDFAAAVLRERMAELGGAGGEFSAYMIGDNPESDIAGANAAGWSSVLVRTGVYDPAQGPPAYKPTWEAADVEEAVRWAIQREIGAA
ncbi:HAD-hyrolase-like-domain-containing protein, partial [Amylostereum chailletii]